ncbi:hypothetical protein GGS20DRAFT_536690 [Poronia punctata]|nr:hypothetical protein GGS20DRAFT_536690 [Poronia punctata]
MKPVRPVQSKSKGTDNRKRPRGQPKSKPNPKASSKPSRRSKQPQSEEGWFSIRDIIDEKAEGGRVQYLIDWEGTDNNGKPYEPTWEPAENVTDVAINAWLDKKIQEATRIADSAGDSTPRLPLEAAPDTSTQDTEPVQASNWRRVKRKAQQISSEGTLATARNREHSEEGEEVSAKRRRTEGFSTQAGGSAPHVDARNSQVPPVRVFRSTLELDERAEAGIVTNPQAGQIVIELPGATTFDTSDFRAITLSQSTQQSRQTPFPELQHPSSVVVNDARVIPDSQDTQSLAIGDLSIPGAHSNSHQDSSAIPSRQQDPQFVPATWTLPSPNTAEDSGPDPSGSRNTDQNPDQNPDQDRGSPQATSSGPSRRSVEISSPAFQSQPAFDWDIPAATSQATTSHNSIIPASIQRPTLHQPPPQPETQHTHSTHRPSTPSISQAAQIVQPLSSHPAETISQSEIDSPAIEEGDQVHKTTPGQDVEVIPGRPRSDLNDTRGASASPSVSGRLQSSPPIPETRLAAVEKVDESGDLPCITVDQTHKSRPSTPCTTMDGASAAATPESVRDRLRRMREEHFSTPPINTAASPLLAASTPAPADPVLPIFHNSTSPTEARGDDERTAEVSRAVPSIAPLHPLPSLGEVRQIQAESPFEAAHPTIDASSSHDHVIANAAAVPMHPFIAPPMEQPATLNPSTLTLSIENEADGSPSVQTDDGLTSLLPLPGAAHSDDEGANVDYSHTPAGSIEHIITLPFQASIRPQYNDIIRDNERLIHEYNSCYQVYPHKTPRQDLVEKLDIMFNRLFDICDIPPFADDVSSLPSEQVSRHVSGTNGKFAFVAEFLDKLLGWGSDKRILILARPGKLSDLLDHVIRSKGPRYRRSGREVVGPADARHPLSVTLCSTTDEPSVVPKDSDVVIVFDHTFSPQLISSGGNTTPPTILTLVTTASIQHLNMNITDEVQPLERKNLLMRVLVTAMPLVENPEITPSPPPSPHLTAFPPSPLAIARKFAAQIQMPEEDEDGFYWEPQKLPEEVFGDIFSQINSTQFTGPVAETDGYPWSRKRPYAGDDDDRGFPKRPKMAQPEVVSSPSNVSEGVRSLFKDSPAPGLEKGTVMVSVEELETIARRLADLQSKVGESKMREREFRQLSDRAQKEVNSYRMTSNQIQRRYMEALFDRGIFETNAKEAQEKAAVLSQSLERSQADVKTLKAIRTQLQAQLTQANRYLMASSNPSHTKLGEMENALETAKTETQRLQQRLVLLQSDADYTKNLYDQSSQRASELAAENRAFEKQIAELTRKADSNIVEANKVQARNEVRSLSLQVKDYKSQLRDRELELNRAKDELRALKTGRRETRQSSVPHSPRLSSLGVMSPRTGNRGPSAMGGPSSSRGTSPAPPTGVFEAPGAVAANSSPYNLGPGASRLSHLRDQRF